MRELIIGIKVVRPNGSIVKGGAKVVKNVAGYDLPKLYVGSLGTLGIIVEGTFRLHPIPEASQTYLATFPNLEMTQETVFSILNSSIVPTCLEVLNPALLNAITKKLNLNLKRGNALAVRIESVEKAVRDQISKLKQISEERKGDGILLEGDIEESLWQEIREFPWKISNENRTVCKASVLITDVAKVLRASEELARNSGLRIYLSGRAGNGVLIIAIEVERPFDYAQGSPQGEVSAVVEAIKSLRALVSSLNGTLVIQETPSFIKSQVDIWGEVGSSRDLMEKLKNLFDPHHILNPGKFI
jgi:glycolate oxidase FAD binding subunit